MATITSTGIQGTGSIVPGGTSTPAPTYTPPKPYVAPTQQQAAPSTITDFNKTNPAVTSPTGKDVFGNQVTLPSTNTSEQTPKTNQDRLGDEQAQRAQADADYQAQAQQVHDTILNIQNGTAPLTAGQQAQIDGLKQQFQVMIDQQNLINTGSTGLGNIRGYQKGAAEYDPTFQVKTIGAIASAGQQKVADLNTRMASAVAQLTQSFHDNDIKAVTEAWNIYQDAQEKHAATLEKTISDTQKAIKEAHDAAKEAQDAILDAQKVEYERTTKPINDLAEDAAKNGASASTIAAIRSATSVADAIAAAGDSLQTATGDAGAYLFEKRQAERSGKTVPDYATWSKNLEQQKLNSKLAEIRATEGIKFQYDLALEKAKNSIANAPVPNYNGEFAATVKLAAQAGGTNTQRAQIKSDLEGFIADNDYKSAYAQILSSASAKLTGANASNFQERTRSLDALTNMRDVLKEYRAMGGDTNIFKGGVESVQNKIGALITDPKYASVATRLTMAFQQYRLEMTGAAFGAQESAEYASVLPSSGNTFALNMAKLDGAQAYLNSVVESTIKNTVGDGGVYIKQYAEAGDQTQQKQADLMDKMQQFRSSSDKNEQMVQELHTQFPDWSLDQIAEALKL